MQTVIHRNIDMTHVLHITASAHGLTSTSRAAGEAIIANLAATTVTTRDIGGAPVPAISGAWADARLVDESARSPEQVAMLEQSDTLIAELEAADHIVISSPIYNFSAPAALKAWMDLVARPRVTFRYGENGPEGLLTGKKATLVISSGGVAVGSEADFLTSHLRFFLGFIGITDVEVLAAKDVLPWAA